MGRNDEKSTKKLNIDIKRVGFIVAGVVFILTSLSLYVQAVPLLYVFVGGYVGVAFQGTPNTTDLMVWAFASLSVLVPTVYGFIQWIRFLYRRFIG